MILQQPASVTVTAGSSATFTVVIANGPCRSEWFVGGIGTYGQLANTITYTTPPTTAAQNGAKVYANLYNCGPASNVNLGNTATAILTVQ